jgi:hypothetical protein
MRIGREWIQLLGYRHDLVRLQAAQVGDVLRDSCATVSVIPRGEPIPFPNAPHIPSSTSLASAVAFRVLLTVLGCYVVQSEKSRDSREGAQ